MQACRKRCVWTGRFQLFHWGSLCCTDRTDLRQHALEDCCFWMISTVWTCKNCFCTSTLYLLYLFISTAAELVVCPQLSPFCPPVSLGHDCRLGNDPALRSQCLHCGSWGHCKVRCAGRPCKSPPAFIRTRSSEGKLELIHSPGGERRELAPTGQKQRAEQTESKRTATDKGTGDKESTKAIMGKRRGGKTSSGIE